MFSPYFYCAAPTELEYNHIIGKNIITLLKTKNFEQAENQLKTLKVNNYPVQDLIHNQQLFLQIDMMINSSLPTLV